MTSSTGSAFADTLRQLDRDHHLHPFTDFRELGEQGTRLIVGGEGIYIVTADGQRLLDGMSGLWCCNDQHQIRLKRTRYYQ